MDINENLKELSLEFAAIQTAIYADLSIGLVLADNAATDISQEGLDVLCSQTVAAFNNPFINAEKPLIEPPEKVIAMRDDGIIISLRRSDNMDNAICLFCSYDIDIDNVLDKSSHILSQMGAA